MARDCMKEVKCVTCGGGGGGRAQLSGVPGLFRKYPQAISQMGGRRG